MVSLGGGSAIDLGKAAAALFTNLTESEPGQSVLTFVEVVGEGRAIQRPPVPFIAVPTTSGTGSEVT